MVMDAVAIHGFRSVLTVVNVLMPESTGQMVGWLVLLGFLIWTLRAMRTFSLFWSRPLPDRPQNTEDGTAELSILIAGRNEAKTLREALRKWHQVEGDWELLFIDDRSEDQTPEILEEMHALDPRIKFYRVDHLPAGWLGKNHALHYGVQQTDRKWFLFTDADIIFEPQSLLNAMSFVDRQQLDFLCLMPQMTTNSAFEGGMLTAFGFLFVLGTNAPNVRNPKSHSFAGIGAFNLIKRTAYEKMGGHEFLKLKVIDDVMLGGFAKYTGARCDFVPAVDQLSVKWQDSAWGIIKGLEKNTFAAMQFSWLLLMVFTAMPVLAAIMIGLSLIYGDFVTRCGLVGLLVLWHLLFGWYGWKGTKHAFCLPFLFPSAILILFAFWRSAWVTTWAGGIRWRETFYSLKELKDSLRETPLPSYRSVRSSQTEID